MAELHRVVPRVVEANDNTELFTMAHQITSTPAPLDRVDAIAVMPGLGEHKRVIAAVSAWEQHTQARHLLVAGTNSIEKTQHQPTLEWLRGKPVNLERTEGVETQVSAEHTRDQAEWLVGQVRTRRIGSLAIFVSNWHLPRAYSTVIKSMLDSKMDQIPVFPAAVAVPLHSTVPETGVSAAHMSAGEAERIKVYRNTGHVASPEELDSYLGWLWQQTKTPIEQ